jgi:hypothetical protein
MSQPFELTCDVLAHTPLLHPPVTRPVEVLRDASAVNPSRMLAKTCSSRARISQRHLLEFALVHPALLRLGERLFPTSRLGDNSRD